MRRLIERLESQKAAEAPLDPTFEPYFGSLRGHPAVQGDPVERQRKLRDEWASTSA